MSQKSKELICGDCKIPLVAIGSTSAGDPMYECARCKRIRVVDYGGKGDNIEQEKKD